MSNPRDIDAPGGDFGPLARDLIFMVRTLQSLLRPEGQTLRAELEVEAGVIGVVSIIWLKPGISQNDLARSLVLKKSAVTALVTRLEDQGLVSRQRSARDRRMNTLTLTPEGEALIARIRARVTDMNDRLFRGVPDADRETFFRVMEALVGNLKSAGS